MLLKNSARHVGNMTFFHSCNESGLFSQEALETIVRFPMVTHVGLITSVITAEKHVVTYVNTL